MSKTAKKTPTAPAPAGAPYKNPNDPDIAFSPADIAEIQGVAVQKAKQGDMQAIAIVERMWRRRGSDHAARGHGLCRHARLSPPRARHRRVRGTPARDREGQRRTREAPRR